MTETTMIIEVVAVQQYTNRVRKLGTCRTDSPTRAVQMYQDDAEIDERVEYRIR